MNPVSDDEEKQPIPNMVDFLHVSLPRAGTDAMADPTKPRNHTILMYYDSSNLDQVQPVAPDNSQENAPNLEIWADMVPPGPPAMVANPLVTKSQVVDYHNLSPLYPDNEAHQNAHTVGSKGIPNTILQMAFGKAYIPFSMLTTAV